MTNRVGVEDAARRPAEGRLALGCAAGLAVGAAASWLRFAVEGTLQIHTGTIPFIAASLLLGAGLGLAGACALSLARSTASDRPHEILGWAVLVHLCAAPALALTSRDLFSNVAYGAMQLLGKSPYLAGPRAAGPGPLLDLVAPRWVDAPSAYGPVISALSRLAAAVGAALASPVWGGGAAFKVAMLLCSLGTLALAHAHARAQQAGTGEFEGFALLAFSPLLAWEVSAQAHNDGVLVLALMAFVWAASQGRELAAVLALATGVLAKLAAAPLLALYLLLVLRRSRARALALGLAVVALGALLVWPYWKGLATLSGPGAALGGDIQRHAHSLADLLCLVLEPFSSSAAAVAYRLCWVGSFILCAAIFARAAWRSTSLERVLHDGLVLFLAYCLTAPWFQPWYATWLLPLAAAERDPAFRRMVAVYTLLTVVQWALPLDPVTTVAANVWVAIAWYRLARGAAHAPAAAALG